VGTPSRGPALTPNVEAATAPTAPFLRLTTLWIQITGTWCNLRCTHCINASGPADPWLPSMDARSIRHAIREAETLGVKEIYFTGGEPFLHPEILPLLKDSLAVAPTSVLTNGTRIDVRMAAALARLAGEAAYSLASASASTMWMSNGTTAFEAGAPGGTRSERSSSSRPEGSSPL